MYSIIWRPLSKGHFFNHTSDEKPIDWLACSEHGVARMVFDAVARTVVFGASELLPAAWSRGASPKAAGSTSTLSEHK